jgi:hypothetical protein
MEKKIVCNPCVNKMMSSFDCFIKIFQFNLNYKDVYNLLQTLKVKVEA